MKNPTRTLTPLLAAVAILATLPSQAAQEKPKMKEDRKDLRVLTGPEGRRPFFKPNGDRMEKEKVTFLGIETSPVPTTLSVQLGLARGTGLVVEQVAPDSPAAASLKQHDILLQLDDQILIEARQLSVLIRNHKEGDEVTLTYLRAGQKATAKVKLGTHEVPKMAEMLMPGSGPRPGPFRHEGMEGHEEWDRVLSLLQRAHPAPDGPAGAIPPPARIRIDQNRGPGVRAMSINAGNSNLLFSDDDGSLELTMKDGTKTLVAKDAKGEQIFSGPVTTPDERRAVPDKIRGRLEKLESMHDVTFRTDGDFQGGDMRLMRPRGIALPPSPGRVPAPAAFF